MKAVVLRGFGGPEQLEFTEVPQPVPAVGEVLIRVLACGVCYHDGLNRAGRLGRTPLPAILGHEATGEVAAVGVGVDDLKVGDRVVLAQRNSCGRCRFCYAGQDHLCRRAGLFGEESPGGYAEYMVARANVCVPLPASIPFEQGAVLACGVATALHALRRGRVTVGESVLITGASGGIGVHAVQLARLAGARAIAVTTSPGKAGLLQDLGAEVVVAPDGQFARAVRDLTGGTGVDCVIEITGAPTLNTSLRSVRLGGRVVIVGNVEPQDVPFNPGMAIMKELDILGSDANTRRELEEAVELVARGAVRPIVGEVLPLEAAHTAHQRLHERRATGRIILTMP